MPEIPPEITTKDRGATPRTPQGGARSVPDLSGNSVDQDEKLDEALDETFPASDPIALSPIR